MAELGVVRPTYEPRSHDFVAEVIALAATLVDRGAPTSATGPSYFHAAGVPERAGLNREKAIALAREHGGHPDDPDKDDPLDAVAMATFHRGRAGLVESLGPRTPGLACRVHRHGSGDVRTGG